MPNPYDDPEEYWWHTVFKASAPCCIFATNTTHVCRALEWLSRTGGTKWKNIVPASDLSTFLIFYER